MVFGIVIAVLVSNYAVVRFNNKINIANSYNMNIINPMMLSCIKATALIEAKTHNPLSFIKNMQLELHVALCAGCRSYMEQTKSIHELLNTKKSPVSTLKKTIDMEA